MNIQYIEGVQARSEGKLKIECPYVGNNIEAINWVKGWNKADELISPIEKTAEKAIKRVVRGLVKGEYK